jgi:hypothetical protein
MLIHDEESKTDYVMERLIEDSEFKQFLLSKFKPMIM